MSDSDIANDDLALLHDRMAWHVESGHMPGLITLVARNGEPKVDVIGTPSFEDSSPLRRDAIVRIASLSKPISAVVAMMLVDDGVLHLEDAVDEYLPELSDRRVRREIGAELNDTVPAKRAITVDDLLSFWLGFGAVMAPPDTYPTRWPSRSYSSIERAAGKPLEAFMRERLFEPLGMIDTSFSVPADKLNRLTTAYAPDPASGALDVLDGVADSYWSQPPAFPNASGWLVSTIDDFWAFVSMLLGDGTVGSERILSSQSIALMTTDRLNDQQRAAAKPFVGEHSGWGLGMATPAARRPRQGCSSWLRLDRRLGHGLVQRSRHRTERCAVDPARDDLAAAAGGDGRLLALGVRGSRRLTVVRCQWC